MNRKYSQRFQPGYCFPWALTLLLLAVASERPAAGESYQARVVFTNGKQVILDRSYRSIGLECEDFSLLTEIALIDSITPRRESGYDVRFNDGDVLAARALTGTLDYEGDSRAQQPVQS